MKNILYAFCLLFLVVACQRDVFPTDLLYQRWQLVRYRQGASDWVQNKSTVMHDTEYRPDGTLVYRLDGQVLPIETRCCAATRFQRRQNEIMFNEYVACAFALCVAPATSPSIITELTGDLLELTNGETVNQYKSVR